MNTEHGTEQASCVPLRLSSKEALARVNGGVRSLWRPRHTHATLRYKPHWEVKAGLVSGGRAETGHRELVAVVDGLTGIARCRRPDCLTPEFDGRPIEGQRFVAPAVHETRARESAEEVMRRTARRRRMRLVGVGDAMLFYKPVWLIARTPGVPADYIIDADSGVLARILA